MKQFILAETKNEVLYISPLEHLWVPQQQILNFSTKKSGLN